MLGTFTSFSEEAPFTLRRKRPNLYSGKVPGE
jgi:hypothetical protein